MVARAVAPGVFEGIVRLGDHCSGSLIALPGQPLDHKALVLTNGHCVDRDDLLGAHEVLLNQKTRVGLTLFNDKGQSRYFLATQIVYATSDTTDILIYQLANSYAEIEQKTGVRPFLLAAQAPRVGTPIRITSGRWATTELCSIENLVPQLKEGVWTWHEALRFDAACSNKKGMSGSPLIEAGTRTVVGINNTLNMQGRRCSLDNPCEVNQAGEVTVLRNRAYGQQTHLIAGCFNQDFEWDMSLSTCQLPSLAPRH